MYFRPISSDFVVSAGIAPFNASLAEPWVLVLSIAATTQFPTLLVDRAISHPVNPVTADISCTKSRCHSYYFPGRFGQISPSPRRQSYPPNADTFIVKRGPGVQLDFWDVSADFHWAPDYCRIWGTDEFAMTMCLTRSNVTKDALVAGAASEYKLITLI